VDVDGESLAAFASEHELAAARPTAISVDWSSPAVAAEADPAAAAPDAGREAARTARRPRSPAAVPDHGWRRLLLPALVILLVGETALLGWVLARRWPASDSNMAPVTITSEPAGAEVLVDGQAQGRTPVTAELAAGSHQLQVGVEGATWTQMLDVKPGAPSTLHVVQAAPAMAQDQRRQSATLEITTEPAGLPVSVDGTPRGVSPLSVKSLQPGSHEVTVTGATSVARRTVTLAAGARTTVLISTAAGGGIASGWLTIAAPVPVRIQEGGTLLGSSESPRLLLPVGRHVLEFSNPAFDYRVQRTVQITAGQTAAVTLEPATGTLSVNAQPWAEVWIDGKRIGETPIGNLPLAIGNHDLMLRHPELGERRRTVAVTANTPARLGIDFRQ
jgi:hypothetical protein